MQEKSHLGRAAKLRHSTWSAFENGLALTQTTGVQTLRPTLGSDIFVPQSEGEVTAVMELQPVIGWLAEATTRLLTRVCSYARIVIICLRNVFKPRYIGLQKLTCKDTVRVIVRFVTNAKQTHTHSHRGTKCLFGLQRRGTKLQSNDGQEKWRIPVPFLTTSTQLSQRQQTARSNRQHYPPKDKLLDSHQSYLLPGSTNPFHCSPCSSQDFSQELHVRCVT